MSAISEETKSMIESQVKKGKARKFFLIYKGASIKTLVVFKKGPFGPKIMAAKKEGFKGDVAYGVVSGSGKNLFFQLPGTGDVASAMKVDSWEENPPTKKAKLREFLADQGLKFKPSYHIITDLQYAPDPDAESNVPTPPPPPGSEVADEGEGDATPDAVAPSSTDAVPGPPPPPPDSDAASFTARLRALKPDLDKVMAAQVSVSQEVKLRFTEAGELARNQEFDAAIQILNQLEDLVKQGQEQLAAPARGAGEPGALFNARLKSLLPRIKEAAGTPAGDEAKLKASQAGVIASKKDFVAANGLLDDVEKLVDTAQAPADAADLEAALANWKDTRATVIDGLRKVARAVAKSPHPKLEAALIELNAVIKNLTEELTSQQQVSELERYFTQDDVVADVANLAFDFREPLMKSLLALKPLLPA